MYVDIFSELIYLFTCSGGTDNTVRRWYSSYRYVLNFILNDDDICKLFFFLVLWTLLSVVE